MGQEWTRAELPRYPDDELVNAVLGPAEVDFFENLYAAYADDARRAAYGLLHDPDLAADAAHTAFLELLRYILAGKRWYEPAEARAAVLRNTNWAALNVLRTQRRRREVAMPRIAEPAAEDATWARAEARALSEQVVARLRRSQQAAVRLHFVEGMSSAQAGAQLGISAGAFEARLNRAVRSARRTAHSMGLIALVPLAVRAVRQWARSAGHHGPSGPKVLATARLTVGLATAALTTGAVSAVATRAAAPPGQVTAGSRVTLQRAVAASVLRPATVPLDTPDHSSIVDALRLSPHTAVLLGEGMRCTCGVVFVTQDAGRTWSTVPGPERVTPANRLIVESGPGPVDVVVFEAGGSTFSPPGLSAMVQPAMASWLSSPGPVLPQPCSSNGSRSWCGGRLAPPTAGSSAQSPGWILVLDTARVFYVGGDHLLRCSSDGGASWGGYCGSTA
jgi:RNA polymerase sigma factor (sigma-70 family)